jgi:hypothetical protein
MENGKMDPGFSSLYFSSMKTCLFSDTKHRHCTKTTQYYIMLSSTVCAFIFLFKVKVVLVCEGSGGEDSIFSSPIIESTLEQQSAGLVNSNSVRSIRLVKI